MSHEAEVLNQNLVKKLFREHRFTRPEIGRAFLATPRHYFLPHLSLKEAYEDRAIPTKYEQNQAISSSSEPAMMAIMLEQLQLEPGLNVLEIGAGTGYNAALMSQLVGPTGRVTTLDLDADLVQGAQSHLQAAGVKNVTVLQADGAAGYAPLAPYDRLILTVGAPDITPAWREQLAEGGLLLLPLSLYGPQKCCAFVKKGVVLHSVSVQNCGFMRLRGVMATQDMLRWSLLDRHEEGFVELELPAGREIDPLTIWHWLTGRVVTFDLHLTLSRQEVWSQLYSYLALSNAQICVLHCQGRWAQSEQMPVLLAYATRRQPYGFACGWLSDSGLALVTAENSGEELLRLTIKSYGSDLYLAQKLVAQVGWWNSSGRGQNQPLQLTAYPARFPYVVHANETVIAKPHTHFVVSSGVTATTE